jgi:hypothetical protein
MTLRIQRNTTPIINPALAPAPPRVPTATPLEPFDDLLRRPQPPSIQPRGCLPTLRWFGGDTVPTRVQPESLQKQAFLKSKGIANPPQAISFSGLAKLARHYKTTKDIHIFLAGDIQKDLLTHTQTEFRNEILAKIAQIKTQPRPDLHLLDFFWSELKDDPALKRLSKNLPNLEKAPPSKVAHIHKLLEKNHHGLGDRVRQFTEEVVTDISRYATAIGLNEADAQTELKALAKSEPSKNLGYIYPAQENRQRHGHAETFLVTTAGQIINLIPFPEPQLQWMLNQYSSQLQMLMPPRTEYALSPMASPTGCGALGLSYLKHYLQDDAKLFREGSLLIDFRDERYTQRFHLPPAKVLRYSQSGLYIKTMQAFVAAEENTVTVHHKKQKISIKTLKGLHSEQATKVCRPNGHALTDEALSTFRTEWLEQLATALRRRASMQVKNKNQSLAYIANKLATQVGEAATPSKN